MAGPLKTWYRRRQHAWRNRWRHDLHAPGARRLARFDMNVFDHGYLRRLRPNREMVTPGIWRSSQPGPNTLARLARQGLRTVLNLRGENPYGSYALEVEAAGELGLELIDLPLRSFVPPAKADIHRFADTLKSAPRPILLHCKSGADRAGLASALAILIEGGSVDQARRQLSLRYLHFKSSRSGILDAFVEAYANAAPMPFLEWVDTAYDPSALATDFGTQRGTLVSSLLRRE